MQAGIQPDKTPRSTHAEPVGEQPVVASATKLKHAFRGANLRVEAGGHMGDRDIEDIHGLQDCRYLSRLGM